MAEMLKNTTYEQDNLIIEKKRVETVVVATGEGALLRGQVLGMVTSTGEYKKYKTDATTGEEIPRLILLQDADATSKEVKVQALRTGIVSASMDSFWRDASLVITPDEQLGLMLS